MTEQVIIVLQVEVHEGCPIAEPLGQEWKKQNALTAFLPAYPHSSFCRYQYLLDIL